jgi:hexosaminidase
MGNYALFRNLVAQRIVLFTALGVALLAGCSQSEPPVTSSLEMAWSFDSLDAHAAQSLTTFTLVNNGTMEIAGSDWAIYFNQILRPKEIITKGTGLHFEAISGGYRKLMPDSSFAALAAGESRSFQVSYGGFAGRLSYAPVGVYFIDSSNENTSAAPVLIKENNTYPGLKRADARKLLDEDVLSRYQENARIPDIPASQLGIVPTPVSYRRNGLSMTLGGNIAISYAEGLESEASILMEQLNKVFTGKITLGQNLGIAQILLSLDETIAEEEGYQLNVANGAVVIKGSDPAGVFYGIQTLARLIPVDNYREAKNYLNISGCEITDHPRFDYRGLHLDVARNFHNVDHVKRLIDLMSYYKLNKLHLSLTNDEGWRLEIPGLPELTELGGRRGHTTDENDMLYPAYGSGPFADPDQGAGTGFYSRKEFIDLLRYAGAHHIEIIPEIDVPGHARAAIKAMLARRDKFVKKGDLARANEYLLNDPNDKSEYSSAQHYNDNVVCVCQESSYRFIEKVIDEVVKMYQEADVQFTTIHSGGDEVPHGAWQKSPVCDKWIADQASIESTDDLVPYFLNRFIR